VGGDRQGEGNERILKRQEVADLEERWNRNGDAADMKDDLSWM